MMNNSYSIFSRRLLSLIFLVSLPFCPANGQAQSIQFRDVTNQAGITPNDPNGFGHGSSLGDFNGDGRPDIYMISYGTANFLFRNNGGSFTDIAASAGVQFPTQNDRGMAAADYDNDGDLDIYITAGYTGNVLYRNNGNNTFSDITSAAGVELGGQGQGVAWGDYNNDGLLDLFVTQTDGDNVLFRQDSDHHFINATSSAGIGSFSQSLQPAFFDVDGDGDADLLVTRQGNQANLLYINNGNGTFSERAGSWGIASPAANSQGVAIGDYDRDGDLDVYVCDFDGYNLLFRHDGNRFTEVAASAGVRSVFAENRGPILADFNDDGWLDIYVTRRGDNKMFQNNGNGTFSDVSGASGTADANDGYSPSVADYDGDGALDIFFSNTGQNSVLLQNDGPFHNWLQIKLLGQASNRDGVGAKLTTWLNGQRQTQAIIAGQAYFCTGSDLTAHFALGGSSRLDSLIIQWPSGTRDRFINLTANQKLTLEEGSGDGGGVPDTTPPVIASVTAGNLTNTSATISWQTDEIADSQVEYGLTTGYGFSTPLDAGLVTSHTVSLSGLTANTTYHYRVKSKDAAGNLAVSNDFIFTTPVQTSTIFADNFNAGSLNGNNWRKGTNAGNQAAVASNALELRASGAVSGWVVTANSYPALNTTVSVKVVTPNDDGDLGISPTYSLSAPYGIYDEANWYRFYVYRNGHSGAYRLYVLWKKNGVDNGFDVTGNLVINGAVHLRLRFDSANIHFEASLDGVNWINTYNEPFGLPGYTLNSPFYYELGGYNTAANGVLKVDDFAITSSAPAPDTQPPQISSVAANNVGASAATIMWTTNEVSDSQVEYGLTTNYGSVSPLNSALVTSHSVALSGLQANATYHYRVKSKDTAGNLAISGDRTFTTSQSAGPGLPNLTYPNNEVFTVIGNINSANGAPRSHASVSMHKGYLAVIYSEDGIFSDGGFSFYDMSNPYSPALVFRKDDEETDQLREAHGYGYSSSYPGDYVALQAAFGVQIWDWTDITNPVQLSYLHLPGIEDSDYTLGAWWLCWQAPYIYVGGSGNGIYIVDATDPVNPVLVNRGAGKPNPIPISQTGGFRLGPIFAIGNLLVASSMEGEGYLTMDISDPKNPVLLATQSLGMPTIYSTMVNGNKILGAGNGPNGTTGDGILHVHDISDPTRFVLTNELTIGSRRGYCTFQDGFVHIGGVQQYTKVDIRNDAEYVVVGTATSGIDNRNEDFATPLGNLVVVSDDHGNGSFIVPHQAAPDHTGPEVNMVSPPDNAVNQALTSRVGLTFTDMIDLRSVNNSTFIVQPRGGVPLTGKYSTQTGIVNFFPDSPLQANTVYEIVVPQGGIKDWTGNTTANTFVSLFSTGPFINSPLECEMQPPAPALVGENVTFTASATGGVGTVQYSWRFGDGTPVTPFSTNPVADHIYTKPGHYTVQVTVIDDLSTSSCSGAQTIHYPVSGVLPVASSPIILDGQQNLVWNVNPDNGTATAIDAIGLTKRFEQTVGKEPRTLAQAPDGKIWVVNQADATISVLDGSTGNLVDTIALPYASRPFGVAFSPDGSAGYVTLQATGRLLKLNPSSRSITGDIAVGPTPKGIAISGDSRRIWITRFISPADHGEVVEIDAASFSVARSYELALDPGPDTEASGRGVPNYISALTISPDARRAWVPSKKDNTLRGLFRDGLRLTFESTVRTIVSQIDLLNNNEDLASRLDLNDRDMAVAVQFSRLGDYAFVATQGSNSIEVFDAYNRSLITSIENTGRAPQGMVLSSDGTKLFVHCFMSRSVAVYDVSGIVNASNNAAQKLADISAVSAEKLPLPVFAGKQIFYNAKDSRMNLDGYISCASCHLDGDDDGRVWDFTDRGEGLRNTIALLGRRGASQGRVHWSANFDEIQDFEHDIRNAFGGSGFMSDAAFNTGTRNHPLGDPKAGISPELDALAAYLESLDEAHPSPYRNADGSLTADGAAGKTLFQQLNCAACHAGNDFTDSGSGLMHDVGTIKPSSGQRLSAPLLGLDTPTLRGLWQTPPYLHDGSAATLLDVLTTANPNGIHGATTTLTAAQKQQLAAYLSQIDNLEPPAPDATPAVVLTSPLPNASFTEEEQVDIIVDATSSIGSISTIEFYADAIKLGEDASAPYNLVWTGAAPGAHTLTARAIHSNGIKTLSAPVTINIVSTSVPTISNVTAANVSSQAATITWNTDEASDSQVEYGLDTNYGISTPLDAALVTSHSVSLSGLAANTTYHYRVKSKNAAGNLATSGDFTFTTAPATPAFDVTLQAENMPIKTTGEARAPGWVLWENGYIAQNVTFPATGLYKFTLRAQGSFAAGEWTQAELRIDQTPQTVITVNSATYADFVEEITVSAGTHQVAVAFINEYYDPPEDRNLWVDWLRIQSPGPADTQPPIISNVASSNVTASAATITWTTNEASDSQVEYGFTTSYGSSSPLNPTLVTSHAVPLSGLQANRTYHFRVKSKDAAGNLATSSDFTFFTAPATGITLLSPNGGEWWLTGSTRQITWNAPGSIANVKLELSRNAGATWRAIVASTPNNGSYNWQVPDTVSNSCLIRVSDAANASIADVSNGTFFIVLDALVNFTPSAGNPVLSPGATGSWDENIRERGWFMYENGTYHVWYGGWRGPYDQSVPQLVKLGYATSSDGVNWTKHPGNPIHTQHWTEDVIVVKDGNTYFLYAEDEYTGDGDGAFIDLYTSTNKINWTRYGTVIRPSGTGWEGSDVGTPTVWKEGNTWYMLYEGLGNGIAGQVGLATSSDGKNWTRHPNNPVLSHPFNASLDIAIDSMIKINGIYYVYGHYDNGGQNWVGGLFTSTNLTAWTAYPGNPIVYNSPVIVDTGTNYYLYGLASNSPSPYFMKFSSIVKDINPPVISNVAASNITLSAATITWTTNEASDSQVEYGLTTSYGSSSPLNSAPETSHTVPLSGLQANTTYHYRVKSKDAAGNLAVSGDFTFTTTADITPPVISSVAANTITTTTARIVWTTNETSDSQVEYGLTTSYGSSSPLDPALVTSHTVSLSGLTASTTYHYRVKSKDAAGNLAVSGDFTFTTSAPDVTPPVISNVAANNISSSSATINWNTNEASDSQVEYGLTTSYGLSSPLDPALVTSHTVSLSGLTANTTYHYRVKSKDAAGNLAMSSDFTFTTAPATPAFDVTLQAEDMPIKTTGEARPPGWILWDEGYVAQSVTFPAAGSYKFTLRARGNLAAGEWSQAELRIDQVPQTVITVNSVIVADFVAALAVAGGTHEVSVAFINDYWDPPEDRNLWMDWLRIQSTGPADTQPPVISNVAAGNIALTAATITWATDEASDSQVEYGLTTSYGVSTPLDLTLVTSHTVALPGLQANTTYHYRVKSKDAAGNLAVSSDFTFTTLAPDVTPPVISNVAAGNITLTAATITWATDEASDSQVEYGLTTSYGSSSPLNPALVTSHTVTLSGLQQNTTYHYRVKSKDAAGNLAVSSDFTFTTVADVTPPVISSVAANNITTTTARIVWATNEASDSQVEYGLTTSYGSSSPLDPALVTSHAVSLSGLTANTTYHYRVKSKDAAGNLAVSNDFMFTTSAPDVTPPVISNVAANNITASAATIAWATNEASDSQVEYGLTTSYGSSSPLDPALVTSHTVSLSGLTANSTYHYRVKSKDAAGNLAVSSDFTFTTAPATPAFDVTLQAESMPIKTTGDARPPGWLLWDEGYVAQTVTFPAAGLYKFTLRAQGSFAAGEWSQAELRIDQAPKTTITVNSATYADFVVEIAVAAGGHQVAVAFINDYWDPPEDRNLWVDWLRIQSTGPADTQPPVISNVAASNITLSAATITWTTNEASDSQVEYGLTTSYGSSSPLNPAQVTSHSVPLSGLQANTTYHYRVKSKDAAGNLAVSGDFTFTTSAPDVTPPVISNVAAGNIALTAATITWATDEASDSQVEYGLTTSYGSSSPLNPALVTAHAVALSGLQQNTTYHYRVKSKDAAGNLAVSSDFTFTTTADVTPPVISNVAANNITTSAARIVWTTNEASDSQVEYGLTTSYGSSSPLDPALVTSHAVSLSGLTANTTYHYRVKSKDAAGNLAVSGDFTFTTSAPDVTPPVISNVAANNITASAASIAWTTNEASDSQVEYGLTTSYGNSTPLDPALVTSHTVALSGLTANTIYHYRVKSKDAAGNLAVSNDFTFTTAPATPAFDVTLQAESMPIKTTGEAQPPGWILWDEGYVAQTVTFPAAGLYKFTLRAQGKFAGGEWPQAELRIDQVPQTVITVNSATYADFVVEISVAAGAHQVAVAFINDYWDPPEDRNLWVDWLRIQSTGPVDTQPPVISNVAASNITLTAATITWTTNEASDSQVEYGLTTSYGSSSPLNPAQVTSHSVPLSGLQANTTYHYRVKSKDAAGNLAVSGDFTFTTTADVTPPVISNVAANNISTTTARIVWTTNEASDSQVEYGLTASYGSSSPLDPALMTSHTVSLSGLTANTIYHYRVKSKDAAGNLAVSGDFIFTTLAPDVTPPAISNVAASNITLSSATITWTTDEVSDSQVEYGLTTSYGSSSPLDPALVTAHEVSLSGLTAGTTYHYRVKSKDAAGNLAVSGDAVFAIPSKGNVAFANIESIYAINCVRCHQGSQAPAGLVLLPGQAYANTVNVPSTEYPQWMRVQPNNRAVSWLYEKIVNQNPAVGSKMENLSADEIAMIGAWIDQGATAVPSPPYLDLEFRTASLPLAEVNITYNVETVVWGGLPPYQFSVINGDLPPGLNFNSGSGKITGKPNTAGTYSFTIQVRDSQSPSATLDQAYSLIVNNSQTHWQVQAPDFRIQPVVSDLDLPVNIAFVPNPGPNPSDPYFYVTLLYGSIVMVQRDFQKVTYASGLLNFDPRLEPNFAELGVVGIVVEPNSGDVFTSLAYDSLGLKYGKVLRLHSTDGGRTAATQTTIISGIPIASSHQIHALTIGPDGKLYLNSGDGFLPSAAQNINDLRGKILRMNLDGSLPADNPFPGSYTYASGLRNPFGAAWRSSDNKLYLSDNGPGYDDRLIKVTRGSNYGWPDDLTVGALYLWNPTVSPVAVDFLESTPFPSAYAGQFFVGLAGATYLQGTTTRGKEIQAFQLDGNGKVVSESSFLEYVGAGYGTVIGLEFGPDGLYFTDIYGENGFDESGIAHGNVYRIQWDVNDTAPPVISNVQATNVKGAAATIVWQTNEPAKRQVEYGLTTNYGNWTPLESNLLINHSMTLSQLAPETTYHFRVWNWDAADNSAVSNDFTFTTTMADSIAPAISNVHVDSISAHGALILWSTSEPATSEADYGTTANYGFSATDPALVTAHRLWLTGLADSTLYHFRVRSTDANGNETISGDNTFITLFDYSPQFDTLLEAENMPIKTTGDARPPGWLLWDEGYVAQTVVFPAAGLYKFTLRAQGNFAGGQWSKAELRLDQIPQAVLTVNSTAFAEFAAQMTVAAGAHEVAIAFINDYWDPPEDRNLWVDWLRIEDSGAVAKVSEGQEEPPALLREAVPSTFALQNYPNPFNAATRINVSLPHDAEIRLAVYDLAGREVQELMAGPRLAGTHEITWDGRSRDGITLSSGVYLLRLRYRAGEGSAWSQVVRRVMMVK